MKSKGRPFNGPSTTGNPSGKGRGNNPAGGARFAENGLGAAAHVPFFSRRVMKIHGTIKPRGEPYTIFRYQGRTDDKNHIFRREIPGGRGVDLSEEAVEILSEKNPLFGQLANKFIRLFKLTAVALLPGASIII